MSFKLPYWGLLLTCQRIQYCRMESSAQDRSL